MVLVCIPKLNEVINMEMLANGSIDGFIISMSRETMLNQDYQHFNETLNEGIPLVMFDRIVNEIPCDKVAINDKKGAQIAVETLLCHLINLLNLFLLFNLYKSELLPISVPSP